MAVFVTKNRNDETILLAFRWSGPNTIVLRKYICIGRVKVLPKVVGCVRTKTIMCMSVTISLTVGYFSFLIYSLC